MKNQDQIVQEEMRKLIRKSCVTRNNLRKEFYAFHKSLLKFFFGVADVSINYETQSFILWNAAKSDPRVFYDRSEAVGTKVSYTDLDETLEGCLESGTRQHRFYKSLLFTYNTVFKRLEQGTMSSV